MRSFYRSLDIQLLWQDFCGKIDKGGRPLYKSARSLARAVGTNDKQVEFLAYLFGPELPAEEIDARFAFVTPLDFVKKRNDGAWFTEDALKAHSKAIRESVNALESLRSAGNGVTLHALVRAEKLMEQIDRDFSGHFLAEGVTFQENAARARLYMELHERAVHMLGYAQDLYAKAHGINFADSSGFEKLLMAQALVANATTAAKESRTEKVLNDIVQMVLEKGARHNLDLPASVTSKVITMTSDVKKKASVM
jgi:hypothetical protein